MLIFVQIRNKFLSHFMETDGSLPCSHNPPLEPILSQMSPVVDILAPYFLAFIITLSSNQRPRTYKLSFLSDIQTKICMHFSSMGNPCPGIFCGINLKFVTTKYSPASHYLFCLRSKCFPQRLCSDNKHKQETSSQRADGVITITTKYITLISKEQTTKLLLLFLLWSTYLSALRHLEP
jgi:hypothetical protein